MAVLTALAAPIHPEVCGRGSQPGSATFQDPPKETLLLALYRRNRAVDRMRGAGVGAGRTSAANSCNQIS